MREGVIHRLRWRQDGKGLVVEEQGENGDWQATDSQRNQRRAFPDQALFAGSGLRLWLETAVRR